MGRVLETPVQKRFSDLDPFRHVNNVAQQSYFDVGKTDFYARVLGEEVLLGDLRVVTVSTSTSYMGQVRMHDDVRVTTTCEKVGNKSMTSSGSSWTGRCAAKAGRCWSSSTSSGRRAAPCPMRGGRGLRRSEPSGFPAGRPFGRTVVRRKRAGVPFRAVPGRPLPVAALVRPLRLPLLSFVKKNCTIV